MDHTNPPAAVQSLESRSAIVKRIASLNTELDRSAKLNLERALEMGRALLRLRAMCQTGEWMPALEEAGVSSQRASEFMRGAQRPASERDTWRSINDLRRAIGLERVPSESDTPTGGNAVRLVSAMGSADESDGRARESSCSSSTIAGMAPEEPEILCEDCQRRGPRRDCAKCEELALVKPSTPPPPRAPRAAPNGPKPGKPAFSVSVVEKPMGELTRAMDVARKHFGDSKYFQTIDRLLLSLGQAWKSWKDAMQE
jgi:hypothetical protein